MILERGREEEIPESRLGREHGSLSVGACLSGGLELCTLRVGTVADCLSEVCLSEVCLLLITAMILLVLHRGCVGRGSLCRCEDGWV